MANQKTATSKPISADEYAEMRGYTPIDEEHDGYQVFVNRGGVKVYLTRGVAGGYGIHKVPTSYDRLIAAKLAARQALKEEEAADRQQERLINALECATAETKGPEGRRERFKRLGLVRACDVHELPVPVVVEEAEVCKQVTSPLPRRTGPSDGPGAFDPNLKETKSLRRIARRYDQESSKRTGPRKSRMTSEQRVAAKAAGNLFYQNKGKKGKEKPTKEENAGKEGQKRGKKAA